MIKETLILEAGADGGSVRFVKIDDYYLYTTDESALKDFVPELSHEKFHSKSVSFNSFFDCMISLMAKYKIFGLYPLSIHPDYKKRIIPFYLLYVHNNKPDIFCDDSKWDKILYDSEYDKLYFEEINPFWCLSWQNESWGMDEYLKQNLPALFGKCFESIRRMGSNNGSFVAFQAIENGYAVTYEGRLYETEKWLENNKYSEFD